MLESLDAYLNRLFSVPRSLSDGTPIPGPSPEEHLLLIELIADFSRQGDQPGFLGCYELNEEANPYVTYLLCARTFIETIAQSAGKTLVFAATTGAMKAKASLNHISLSVLAPIEFVTWGDVAKLMALRNSVEGLGRPDLLKKVFIIGDVDFELGNATQQMKSSDGMVSHDQTLRALRALAEDAEMHMLLFHRQGWAGALDVRALRGITRTSRAASKGGSCFIATVCYGSAEHPTVRTFRRFRDEELAQHRVGRMLIRVYEGLSPPLAEAISSRPWAKRLVRQMIVRPLGRWAERRMGSSE